MALTQVQGGMILPSTTLTTPIVATTLGVGGATPSTSGAGITFPATQSASSNANTLDDYEEGTWTPLASSSSGSITTYTSRGNYIKIGRTVTITFSITLVTPGTASGAFNIGGLPFVTNDSAERPGLAIVREDALTGIIYNCFIDQNSTTGQLQTLTGGGVSWTTSYNYTCVMTYICKT
jgi:hypothetical protein